MDNQAAYEFINSKDIREHLRKLDYPLTPVQCAFLVWQSKRHTLKEKHEAWEDIIATMPDCPVERRSNCKGWDSLHDMLHGYMAFEQKLLSLFRRKENSVVYEAAYFMKSIYTVRSPHGGYEWQEDGNHFPALESCFRYAAEEAREEQCRFRITKSFMGKRFTGCSREPCVTVEYDAEENILSVAMSGPFEFFSLTEEEEDLYCLSFDGMWFDFPIPFEKGDIVCDITDSFAREIPFVLMGTTPWFLKERHPTERVNTHSDSSDMAAYGYSVDREELFFNDDFRIDYLNAEYYTNPLEGLDRLLTAYSQFEKGKIDAYTLMQLYRMITAEHIADTERKHLCYLREEVFSQYGKGNKTGEGEQNG